MSDRYGVMGHPVAHSKSPRIHAAFARQTGQDLEYAAIHVLPGQFADAVARFRASGGRGLNVTLPFKEEAWALSECRAGRAERARAVNTLSFEAGKSIRGDNTDGAGLLRDLEVNLGLTLRGRRVLLLGAGGAARGVLGPLLDAGPEVLVVANRTRSRARDLVAEFAREGPLAERGLDELGGNPFDLVINATSASLGGDLPPLPGDLLAPGAWCYDLMYGVRPTAFMEWGRRHGAGGVADGLGMLVEQAAESFFIWRGLRPETGPVIAELRRLPTVSPAAPSDPAAMKPDPARR